MNYIMSRYPHTKFIEGEKPNFKTMCPFLSMTDFVQAPTKMEREDHFAP